MVQIPFVTVVIEADPIPKVVSILAAKTEYKQNYLMHSKVSKGCNVE